MQCWGQCLGKDQSCPRVDQEKLFYVMELRKAKLEPDWNFVGSEFICGDLEGLRGVERA